MRGGEESEFDESAPLTMDQLLESWDQPTEDELEHRVTLEAVIDLGSSRPRVAYLREITMLEPVMAMHRALRAQADEAAPVDDMLEGWAVETPDDAYAGPDPFFEDDPFLLEDPITADAADIGFELDLTGREGDSAAPDLAGEDPGETEAAASEQGKATDMIDRRIGRWTTRKAGDS